MWRNWTLCTLLVGMWNGTGTVEKSMVVPQKIKRQNYHRIQKLHIWSYLFIYLPKELKSGSQNDTSTPMFTAALFTITKTWKQCKCPSTGEWMSKVWYIDTVENHSSLKRNSILTYATIQWTIRTLAEWKSQPQKDNTAWFHLYEIPRVVRT